MSEYIVSARKYRPLSFDSVVGQRALTTTLQNAISAHKLAHAYLFCGPRGVGKTTCARIFAKTINCMNPLPGGEACGECESCKAFEEQRSMNIHELDAASNNSVEDIRELCKQVQIPPQIGRYKVFIIDEVHMLSSAAFNAFLKTLEEPPSYVIFILATTEKHKILPTILSRCQVYDFQRMTTQNTIDHLMYVAKKEGYTAEPEALNLIAQKADGGMRDALSIFDQMVSFTGGNLTYEQVCKSLNVLSTEYYFRLVDMFLSNDVQNCLLLLNEVLLKGFDGGNFIGGLATHLRDLLVSRDAVTLPLLEMSEQMRAKYQEQALRCNPRFLYRAIKLCNDCDQAYRTSRNKRLQVEICLIQAAQLTEDDVPSAGPGPQKVLKKIAPSTSPKGEGTSLPSHETVSTTSSEPEAITPSAPQEKPEIRQPAATPSPAPIKQNEASSSLEKTGDEVKTGSKAPRRPLMKVSFNSLGGGKKKEEASPEVSQKPDEHLTTPLEAEQLHTAWVNYIRQLPSEEVALQQRMLSLSPTVLTQNSFEILVSNPQMVNTMTEKRPDILKQLGKELRNTELKMEIRLEEEQVVRRTYNKFEQLDRMKEENPILEQLIGSLGLEIE